MDRRILVKTALDRHPRVKYHFLTGERHSTLYIPILRYVQQAYTDKRRGKEFDHKACQAILDQILDELKSNNSLCPKCEGPKQPKYRKSLTGGRIVVVCPDCGMNDLEPVDPPSLASSPQENGDGVIDFERLL